MADPNLPGLIAALADPHPSPREQAARKTFELGAALVTPLLREWMADPELASCFETAAGPQTTVGVAVEPERFDAIRAANGMPRLADVPPDQDAKEFELDFPGAVRLDILTSRDPSRSGAIARYLRKSGEGIQQVEVNVSDIDRATEILRTRFNFAPIYPATRAGANGTRVNFFLVSIKGGKLLVELVQG